MKREAWETVVWANFATGALAAEMPAQNTATQRASFAADVADQMLGEYKARFLTPGERKGADE